MARRPSFPASLSSCAAAAVVLVGPQGPCRSAIRIAAGVAAAVMGLVAVAGCGQAPSVAEPSPVKPRFIRLACTTSFSDSGMAGHLLPRVRTATDVDIQPIVVGSGQAIELARRGDVDLVLSHAPELEAALVAEGVGRERVTIMRNDFVLVGPLADPAGVRGMSDAVAALRRIARDDLPFVSRGDRSGTHLKELDLWEQVGEDDRGSGYVESGTGMGATLRWAHEKSCYTLTDRATFLAYAADLQLEILVEGDPPLANPYSMIVVSSEARPGVAEDAAKDVVRYLTSDEGQAAIAEFGIDRFGTSLFTPAFADSDPSIDTRP